MQKSLLIYRPRHPHFNTSKHRYLRFILIFAFLFFLIYFFQLISITSSQSIPTKKSYDGNFWNPELTANAVRNAVFNGKHKLNSIPPGMRGSPSGPAPVRPGWTPRKKISFCTGTAEPLISGSRHLGHKWPWMIFMSLGRMMGKTSWVMRMVWTNCKLMKPLWR